MTRTPQARTPKFRWDGDECLADQEGIAQLYGVSRATVRRYCPPAREYKPKGPGSVQREYDAIAAAEHLKDVAPRPERTVAALRATRVLAALNHRTPEGHPHL